MHSHTNFDVATACRHRSKSDEIAGISMDYSWFIVALLITIELVNHFPSVTGEWPEVVVWSAAVITSLLFSVTLLLHAGDGIPTRV